MSVEQCVRRLKRFHNVFWRIHQICLAHINAEPLYELKMAGACTVISLPRMIRIFANASAKCASLRSDLKNRNMRRSTCSSMKFWQHLRGKNGFWAFTTGRFRPCVMPCGATSKRRTRWQIDVPEVMAGILAQTKGKPWDYYRDMTRQLWDEARHAMMGETGFLSLGLNWPQLVMINSTWSYALNKQLTPKERHAVLY